MNTLARTLIAAALITGATPLIAAEIDANAAAKGLEIAKEVVRRDTGWGDMQASMSMTLNNSHGDASVREMRLKSLEVSGDGDKSLTIFDQPLDVKGTAFLSFTHPVTPDEQWLYLPALKRVKRISSSNKSGPFMGSEYAFEDLTSFEVEKYDFEYLRDDALDGQNVFVVRSFPKYEKSGYTKLEVWIDQSEYRVQKVNFFDRKGDLLKTLSNQDYKQYLNKYWRPSKASMVNHQNGKSTNLVWSNYQFQSGLDDGDFNQNSLQRAK